MSERDVLAEQITNSKSATNWHLYLGFASTLAFLYSLFYTGQNYACDIFGYEIERIDLLVTLVFMTIGFFTLGRVTTNVRDSYLSKSVLWCHAILMVLGAAVALPARYGLAAIMLEGLLVGISFSVLICAWARVLTKLGNYQVLRTVLISTILAALICLVIASVAYFNTYAWALLSFLPLLSVWCLTGTPELFGVLSNYANPRHASLLPESYAGVIEGGSEDVSSSHNLTFKMLAGTFVFGLSAGFMETFGTNPGMTAVLAFPVTLVFLLLLCVAILQLFEPGTSSLDDRVGNLDTTYEAYRLCILVMMAGYLFIYVLSGFQIPGQSIVLAAYLALCAVFIGLFVVFSKVAGYDSGITFGRGFGYLYLGEIAGILLGNIVEISSIADNPPYVIASISGLATLYAYQFLFTESDFQSLTTIVKKQNNLQESCDWLVNRYALSARESEILPYALRGRTSERIATELYISKSTVDTHLKRIYSKCGVHGRQELIDLLERTSQEVPRKDASNDK